MIHSLVWLPFLTSIFKGVAGIHDGRLCCRYKDKSFKPTALTYIKDYNALLAFDRNGYSQFLNMTGSLCGRDAPVVDTARYLYKENDRPWGPIIFEGATTKQNTHIAYVLEGGRLNVGPARIHFFDLDKWDIFRSVDLPEIPIESETKSATGALAWIPDGTADGRFLVGSHIDSTIYIYKISSDEENTIANLMGTFKLQGVDAIDLSGLHYDIEQRRLFSMFREDSWTYHTHYTYLNGTVGHKMGEREALAFRPGGSPPYKHEGIAAAKTTWSSSHYDIWIADQHRYIYEIHWREGSGRLDKCPWVDRRVIGCCYTNKPCQNVQTAECWLSGGYYVGKKCEVDTCANTAFGSFPTGCPGNEYFETVDGECPECSLTRKGGINGCFQCDLQNGAGSQLDCTTCYDGYFLNTQATCTACEAVVPMCANCTSIDGSSVTCNKCNKVSILDEDLNQCVACDDATRGTPNCMTCHFEGESSITCDDCRDGFYLQNLDKTCHDCTDRVLNCALCSEEGVSVQCHHCEAGFFLHENECKLECPLGTYGTRINYGQGDIMDPIHICKTCERNNFNVACSNIPSRKPISPKSCEELLWPSTTHGTLDNVCSGALFNDRCYTGTLEQARKLCHAAGARLCTRWELSQGEGTGTDCGDDNRVWSSSQNDGCNSRNAITFSSAADDGYDSLCSPVGEIHNITCCADGEYEPPSESDVEFPVSTTVSDLGDGFASCWLLGWDTTIGQGSSVCGATLIDGVCHSQKTFAEAQEICASVNAFVCDYHKLLGNVYEVETCGFEDDRIWTNSTESCDEGEKIVGFPRYQGPPPECRDESDGTLSVGCCSYTNKGAKHLYDMGGGCLSGIIVCFAGFCGCATDTFTSAGSCHYAKTYAEAEVICDEKGKFVCTLDQVEAQQQGETSCSKQNPVWTSTDAECADGEHVTRAGNDQFLISYPPTCTSDTEQANVYCCEKEVDLCEDVECEVQTNECRSPNVCVEGQCISEVLPNGSLCQDEAGICVDGTCDTSVNGDLCANVECFAKSTCHAVGECSGGFCSEPVLDKGTSCIDKDGLPGECNAKGRCKTTPMPTSSPSFGPTACADSPYEFKIKKDDGTVIWKTCRYAENNLDRCNLVGVSEMCPLTCNTCDVCTDSNSRFRVNIGGLQYKRKCKWTRREEALIGERCKIEGMRATCRETCGQCSL